MTPENGTSQTPSHYDPHLVPAETAARAQREGKAFGHVDHDPQDPSQVHTRDGYTVDQEGLINNYAVEPPMYIDEPGDLREVEQANAEQRAADRKAMESSHDWHHKGPGII
ncbi:hypothetical protein [Nodosilinea sp. P-1105]|uniref:hypothetical protein n=1 Tax=Nodosilinea sp. P-1105 TaxID=2546229 RepID=UPI00146A8FAC|nr:hypothetical protein [Nodosilinea sp. P-1105]NMF86586.1 hypothetical protein [Nodosilinea sp. P-1105]